ncbi:hypothetical protein, partial [Pediococcus acidilactici]|uniref:hypothetical protein n=1 Tax=Pediococcus acidilactici TaxID=1254 RepID=UPI0019800056
MAFNFSSFVIFVKINTPRIKVFHFNSGGTPHFMNRFYFGVSASIEPKRVPKVSLFRLTKNWP